MELSQRPCAAASRNAVFVGLMLLACGRVSLGSQLPEEDEDRRGSAGSDGASFDEGGQDRPPSSILIGAGSGTRFTVPLDDSSSDEPSDDLSGEVMETASLAEPTDAGEVADANADGGTGDAGVASLP